MVGLKNASKNSTGAPAPRTTLRGPSIRVRDAKNQAIIASAKKAKGPTRSNADGPSIPNSINFKFQPDVPTHVLTVEVRGTIIPKSDMDKDHDEVRCLY